MQVQLPAEQHWGAFQPEIDPERQAEGDRWRFVRALIDDLARNGRELFVSRCRFEVRVGAVAYGWEPPFPDEGPRIFVDGAPDLSQLRPDDASVLCSDPATIRLQAIGRLRLLASPDPGRTGPVLLDVPHPDRPVRITLPPAMPARWEPPQDDPDRRVLAPGRPGAWLASVLLAWPAVYQETHHELIVTGSLERLWRRCADHPDQRLAERLRMLLCQPGVEYRPGLSELEFERLADRCERWLVATPNADALAVARARRHRCGVLPASPDEARLADGEDPAAVLSDQLCSALSKEPEILEPGADPDPGWSDRLHGGFDFSPGEDVDGT